MPELFTEPDFPIPPHLAPLSHNAAQTARLLSQNGFPITRQYLSKLIRNGEGPLTYKAKKANGYWENIIDWNIAIEWAQKRFANKPHRPPIPAANDDPTLPKRMLQDQFIFHLKETFPQEWEVIQKNPGQERIRLLNEIADFATKLAEQMFLNLVVNTSNSNDPEGKGSNE